MKPSLGEAVLAQVTVVSAKDSNILTDIKWHRVSWRGPKEGSGTCFVWVEGDATGRLVWDRGGLHGGDGIWKFGPSGPAETRKLNIISGENSKSKCSVLGIRWCVSSGTLWFTAEEAGLCKPHEGGAWAGFVLMYGRACAWEGLHIKLFIPAERQCLEVGKLSPVTGSDLGGRNFELQLEKDFC